jgi:hypothetical protein
VYPIIQVTGWFISGRVRHVVWTGVFLVVGILLVSHFGMDWSVVRQSTEFFKGFERFNLGVVHPQFRDNSTHAVILYLLRFQKLVTHWPASVPFVAGVAHKALLVVIIVWFARRGWVREKNYREYASSGPAVDLPRTELSYRLHGHASDAVIFGLLASPLVWEHHYVVALVPLIYAVATRGRDYQWQILMAGFLMLAVPTFDVFPLSYHRLAGLFWITTLTSPSLGVLAFTSQFELQCCANASSVGEGRGETMTSVRPTDVVAVHSLANDLPRSKAL